MAKSSQTLKQLLGRYEHVSGASSKFWEVVQEKDGDYTVSWGKLGTPGSSVSWDGTNEVTESSLRSKALEKIKQGYKKV